MEVFTEKVGGKYCPSFRLDNQTFHLRGYDSQEEAEWAEKKLKVCFSNYGLRITRKFSSQLFEETTNKLNELLKTAADKIDE